MEANIRELKAHLSQYIRRAAAGEAVTVSIHNRPVARIIPIKASPEIGDLAKMPGISWNGGKPKGLPQAEIMRKGVLLSRWISQDRR